MNTILAVRNAVKNFGAVRALRGVSLEIAAESVHAICGDNGAGKSTLIKLIAGVEMIDSGEIRIKGKKVHPANPYESLRSGVATIHQDLAIAPRMAIFENIFMGSEITRTILGVRFLNKKEMRRRSLEYVSRFMATITDMDTPLEELSGGQRQTVAICRALRWNADIVIMDEPTAALGVRETDQALDLIRTLRDDGNTIILISHNMKDVVAVADTITILRNGENQAVVDGASVTADELAHLILSGERDVKGKTNDNPDG